MVDNHEAPPYGDSFIIQVHGSYCEDDDSIFFMTMSKIKLSFIFTILMSMVVNNTSAYVGDRFTLDGVKYEITSVSPKEVKVIANYYSGDI